MNERMNAYRAAVEDALKACVPDDVPEPLRGAMRYSLLAGGKRLRPVMLLASHELLAPYDDEVLRFAVSLEMIHTYSLIHDDLPAMDNDTLRRGRPTNHVVYGEAVAILAGDALQSLAFETMLASGHPKALQAMRVIARRAGVPGMIAGQTLDVTREGETPTPELVSTIHAKKTACLLTAPVEAGLILAGADEAQCAAGRAYGEKMGIAFQITDDLLDVIGDAAALGKHTGKDAAEGKLTWLALFGIDQSRADAERLTEEACGTLAPFGKKAEFLQTLARDALARVQ